MSPEEMRLECLRLASCQGHPDHARVIEAAAEMFRFVTGAGVKPALRTGNMNSQDALKPL